MWFPPIHCQINWQIPSGMKLRRPNGVVFDNAEFERQKSECLRNGVLRSGQCTRHLESGRAQDWSGCTECRIMMCELIQNVKLRKDPFGKGGIA